MKDVAIAIAGATGVVGREIASILAERGTPAASVAALASRRSIGKEISFGNRTLVARALENFDFSKTDICLMSAGGDVSRQWAPRIGAQNCVVIDNSSAWRYHDDVPLIVPEVNGAAIEGFAARHIIANPNCSTIQLVLALKPIHDLAGIERVNVATYQSVSGAGSAAMDELFNQTRSVFVGDPVESQHFSKRMAFNVIPHIDKFMEDGSTFEERKVVIETQKILDPDIAVNCTAVRVPVFIGHGEAVNVELARPLSAARARAALREAPGCLVVDKCEAGGYTTPHECAGEDMVHISRIRADTSIENGLNFWVVADNLRKGAALNAVQIAELLVEKGLAPQNSADAHA